MPAADGAGPCAVRGGDRGRRPRAAPARPGELGAWLLLALLRHERRQEWVGWLVESRLGVERAEIGGAGAFAHPDDGHGEVPGEPDWSYYFHGRGCCLTHRDGAVLDVDFGDDGNAQEIDPYFYAHYLRSEPRPGWCERRLRAPAGCEEAWMYDLRVLAESGWIEQRWRFRLTETGRALASALEPLAEALDAAGVRSQAWLAARMGDAVAAAELLPDGPLRALAELQRETRVARLRRSLATPGSADAAWALAALGGHGAAVALPDTAGILLQRPVGPLQHTALKILQSWAEPEVRPCLIQAFEIHSARPWRERWRRLLGRPPDESDRPRRGLVVDLAEALLRRFTPAEMPGGLRRRLIATLSGAFRSREAEAAALLWLLEARQARRALEEAARSSIPCSRREGACLLGLIGDERATAALLALAEGPAESGHEAACVLSLLPAEHLQRAAAEWQRRHDGYEEAEGTEVEMGGKRLRVWSFEDLSRLNQRGWVEHTMEQLRVRFGPLFLAWRGVDLTPPRS